MQQLKSGFKKTINWNKYETKVSTEVSNPYLHFLIYPIFQGVNRPAFLSFENKENRTVHTKYYLKTVEKKNYSVMIDRKNFFNQPVKNNLITYENIKTIATGQEDNYTAGCLLDYNYFNNYYKIIAIDLSKQQALDTDPNAIQQINFTRNLSHSENVNIHTIIFFITEKAK